VPIAGMVAADLTEWIRSGGLLRFCSHSRCGHPHVGSAGAQARSGETMNPFLTTAVCQRRGSRLRRSGGRVPCEASGQGKKRRHADLRSDDCARSSRRLCGDRPWRAEIERSRFCV
jgi:hypothetical protein